MKSYIIRTLLIVMITLAAYGCSQVIQESGDIHEDRAASTTSTPLQEPAELSSQAVPPPIPTKTAILPVTTVPAGDDQETKPTPIPTSIHYDLSRMDAVPPGETATIGKVEFMINGLIRPADEIVLNASDANRPPPEGMEYVFVYVVEVCAVPKHVECFVRARDMRLIGSSGIERRPIDIIDYPVILWNRHLIGGAPGFGFVAFMVDQDEHDLVFYYLSGGDEISYLSIE